MLVSVGRGAASVSVASITTGTVVASLKDVGVSVFGGAEVTVLTGATVAVGVLVPLNRKKPPARAAIATTGTMTKKALNDRL